MSFNWQAVLKIFIYLFIRQRERRRRGAEKRKKLSSTGLFPKCLETAWTEPVGRWEAEIQSRSPLRVSGTQPLEHHLLSARGHAH